MGTTREQTLQAMEDAIGTPAETSAKLDHTLRAYGELEKRCGEVKRERNQYRQAALELQAEIRNAIAWAASGGPQNVADAMLLKTADKWRDLLDEE